MKFLSISKIKAFKSCRRLYELRYIENLKPIAISNALQIGTSYHELLEEWNKTGSFISGFDKPSAMAMAYAYTQHIDPIIGRLKNVEEWYEMPITDDYKLHGRIDGMTEDGIIVDHKTTSLNLEEYEYNLQWDEQAMAYMLLTGKRKMIFTVIRKPTIRQKKTESDEDFYQRMVDWYDEDTFNKIRIITIERSDEELEAFKKDLVKMTEEMQTDNFYKNTNHCRCWGRRCEYSEVCLNYDPNQNYFGFEKETENEY